MKKEMRKPKMKAAKIMRIVFSALGILFGIGMIIAGIVLWDDYSTSSIDTVKFGADFYTEIHKAVARAVWILDDIEAGVKQGIGTVLCAMGAGNLCFFGLKFADALENYQKPAAYLPAATAAAEEAAAAAELPEL